jgi:hypothetical protein
LQERLAREKLVQDTSVYGIKEIDEIVPKRDGEGDAVPIDSLEVKGVDHELEVYLRFRGVRGRIIGTDAAGVNP